MSIENMVFVPPNGLRDNTFSPTTPISEASIRSQIQSPSDQLKDYINNTVNPNVVLLDGKNIKDSGDQSIAGVKTFSSPPIIPAPITDMQSSTKKYVDDIKLITTNETDTKLSLKVTQGTNFTGTWRGYTPVQSDPGIQSTVNDHTSQLANNSQQLNAIPNQSYIIEKAKTVDVNDALSLKANQEDLIANITKTTVNSTQISINTTAISHIPSGSPKGTYATLALLQSAFSTG